MGEQLNLRPYQADIIEGIRDEWGDGNMRVCTWLPTGGGKTEIAAALAQAEMQAGGHTLFVVERKSLCTQGAERFGRYGMLAGILRGEATFVRGYEPVTLARIQTLQARHDREVVQSLLAKATLVIVDEAHILYGHHDALIENMPHIRMVGLTATPLREGWGLRYQALVRGPSYRWMMDQGYLVRPRYFLPKMDDLKSALQGVAVAKTGDYEQAELGRVMREKSLIRDIVGTWKDKAGNRLMLVFAVDVAHSKAICDEFNLAGVAAEHIDYRTKDDDRAAIFRRFRQGETRVLCSVVALAVGFDEPAASCVVLARPTLSLSLHMQQRGRGLRPFAVKLDCLVFDHALNVVRHGKFENFEPPDLNLINKRSDKKRKSDPVYDYRPCGECGAVLEPKQNECHECGHVIRRSNVVNFRDGQLVEDGTAAVVEFDRQRFYRELAWVASNRGYKAGYAYVKYMERFPAGPKPPFAWRDLEPIPASGETLRWLQSREIAWRKSRRAS